MSHGGMSPSIKRSPGMATPQASVPKQRPLSEENTFQGLASSALIHYVGLKDILPTVCPPRMVLESLNLIGSVGHHHVKGYLDHPRLITSHDDVEVMHRLLASTRLPQL